MASHSNDAGSVISSALAQSFSDDEPSSSLLNDGSDPTQSYIWVGKRYLDSMLAEITVRDGRLTYATSARLEFQLAREATSFPYERCYKAVQESDVSVPETLLASDRDMITKFYHMIGFLLLTGSRATKRMLASVIMSRGSTVAAFAEPDDARPPSPPSTLPSDDEDGEDQSEEDLEPNLTLETSQFTSTLFEWCIGHHMDLPTYNIRQVVHWPPRFEGEVQFDGEKFRGGRASQKQAAKHLASREACLTRRISVNG